METKRQAEIWTDISVLRAHLPGLDVLLGIGRKHLFDEMHAIHVAALSLFLFDQMMEIHGMDGDDRVLLLSAAVLHDIGTCYGYEEHHKASLELIRKLNIPGMDAKDQLIVANVARYHRKKPPRRKHKAFGLLPSKDRKRVVKLSAVLRIADALDCAHANKVHHVAVYRDKNGLRLSVQSAAEIKQESVSFRKKSRLFQDTFNKTIRLQKD